MRAVEEEGPEIQTWQLSMGGRSSRTSNKKPPYGGMCPHSEGPSQQLPPPIAGDPDGSRLYLSRSRLARSHRQILGEEA